MATNPGAPDYVLRVENGIFSSNCYIVRTGSPTGCFLVDPGLDASVIDSVLEEKGFRPKAIFLTHGHFDHVGTSDFFQKKYGCPLYLHRADLKLSRASNFLLMACKVDARITVPKVDFEIEDGARAEVDGEIVEYIHVPGHTLGSSFIRFRGAVFTGDSLYKNGVGLVDFPGEDPAVLKASLLRIWDTLPETDWIYPGHAGSGAFGTIKSGNRRLRIFLGLEADPATDAPKRKLTGAEAKKSFDEEVK